MLAKLKQNIKEGVSYVAVRGALSFCFHYIHKKFLFGIFRKIDEKFFKFLFVGFINTLFSYFVYAFFLTLGFRASIALFLQYIIGVLWNFKTTGSIVFKNKDNSLIFKFILSYILTFFINSTFLRLLTHTLNPYIAQAILVLPVAGISFLILKFFVFR